MSGGTSGITRRFLCGGLEGHYCVTAYVGNPVRMIRVGSHIDLLHLLLSGPQRVNERDPKGSANVSGEVAHPGDLIVLFCRHANLVQGRDVDEVDLFGAAYLAWPQQRIEAELQWARDIKLLCNKATL
jgi:hypothetical protein